MTDAARMILLLLVILAGVPLAIRVYERLAPTMKKKHRIWLFGMLLSTVAGAAVATATGDAGAMLDVIQPKTLGPAWAGGP